MNWLKDKKYRTLEGVESASNLTAKEKEILRGINKRNYSSVYVPSKTDLHFLEQCYGTKFSESLYYHAYTLVNHI